MELELPLDSHGFLRRQCPRCEREFKWHHGPTGEVPNDAPDPDTYFCPYCGESAGADEWWTAEQVEAIQAAALYDVMPKLRNDLQDAVRPLNKSGFVKAFVRFESATPPPPMNEQDDMVALASPCHSYEPVKVDIAWSGLLHCLICGAQFIF